MTCDQILPMLNASIDGELSPAEQSTVRKHLASCESCAARHSELSHISQLVRSSLPRYEAPDVLKARIRASLTPRAETPTARRSVSRAAIAASLIVGLVAGGAITGTVMRRRSPDVHVQDEVLSSHLRSLLPGHLTDVASTDQHNVKPWFNGRVPLSPPVPRLDSAGYPLAGGRVDVVDGHTVATTVYLRRQHVINVFAWGSPLPAMTPTLVTRNGYHLVHARRDGIELWFVSDVNAQDLQDFVARFSAASRDAVRE